MDASSFIWCMYSMYSNFYPALKLAVRPCKISLPKGNVIFQASIFSSTIFSFKEVYITPPPTTKNEQTPATSKNLTEPLEPKEPTTLWDGAVPTRKSCVAKKIVNTTACNTTVNCSNVKPTYIFHSCGIYIYIYHNYEKENSFCKHTKLTVLSH